MLADDDVVFAHRGAALVADLDRGPTPHRRFNGGWFNGRRSEQALMVGVSAVPAMGRRTGVRTAQGPARRRDLR